MERGGTNNIYKFRIESSTKKEDCELHKVINERGMNKYVVKEFMTNECKEILRKERKILHYLMQCPFITRLRCTIYNHKVSFLINKKNFASYCVFLLIFHLILEIPRVACL